MCEGGRRWVRDTRIRTTHYRFLYYESYATWPALHDDQVKEGLLITRELLCPRFGCLLEVPQGMSN